MAQRVPWAVVAHCSAGRLRLRIPAMRHNTGYFAEVRSVMFECPGVEHVEVNPVSASVLICHRCTLEALRAHGAEAQLLAWEPPASTAVTIAARLASTYEACNERVKSFTRDEIDILAIAVRQLLRGQILMPAVTALWYVASLLPTKGNTPGPPVPLKPRRRK